jgi:5-methylcytosine-specific restriction endonuclease McrA
MSVSPTPSQLIADLQAQGFRLREEDGRVLIGPISRLTAEQRQQLQANREAIIGILTNKPPSCDCSSVEVRRRVNSNGVAVAAVQCLRCGRQQRNVPVRSVHFASLPPWDERLPERWREQVHQYYQAHRDRENERWWRHYDAYLASYQWKQKRKQVLERDNYTCQGCGVRPAEQVHHLTYRRVGREMNFDLVSVCTRCHDLITGQ